MQEPKVGSARGIELRQLKDSDIKVFDLMRHAAIDRPPFSVSGPPIFCVNSSVARSVYKAKQEPESFATVLHLLS